MLRYISWGLLATVLLIVGLFLHYTLPQRDIVRITGTYNRLTEVGDNGIFYASPDVGTGDTSTRDIRFIEAVRPNGKVIVYRNEDTGWVWPPYFKYDSSNLQAEAGNFKSSPAAPEWVAVTHYGWRAAWLSIYPNAVKIRAVAGPDVSLFPWLNIVILVALALLVFTIWQMLAQFRERMIDPAVDRIGDGYDAAEARAGGAWARFGRWRDSWKSKRR